MYKLVSFVTRGKTRKIILEKLTTPHTPTQIRDMISRDRATVSRTILQLEKKGLVKCLTPEEKIGRFYQITNLGKEVLKELNKIEKDGGKT